MYLVQIFRASPLMGLALCVCLATIFWCILLCRRQQSTLDKVLTGLLGMIAIYEAIRIMKDSGVIFIPGIKKLEGWVDFSVATTYLLAAMILKISSSDRASTKVRLRLVEANEKTVDVIKGAAGSGLEAAPTIFDASPLATFAVDGNGAVVYWNSSAELLLGWKREELLGQRLPFSGTGPLRNKKGDEVEAVLWNATFRSSNGPARGTLTIAAGRSALRSAGIGPEGILAKAELVANQ